MAFNGTGSNVTSLNAANISSGTLAVGRGGTGATTLNAAAVIIGNGTSAPTFVAPGSNGNVLVSNGTAWTSAAPAGGGVTSLNGQTGAITNTSLDAIGSYIAAVSTNQLPANAFQTFYNTGDTISGASLRRNASIIANTVSPFPNTDIYAGRNYAAGGTALSGTWRCMGRQQAGYYDGCAGQGNMGYGFWVRIS